MDGQPAVAVGNGEAAARPRRATPRWLLDAGHPGGLETLPTAGPGGQALALTPGAEPEPLTAGFHAASPSSLDGIYATIRNMPQGTAPGPGSNVTTQLGPRGRRPCGRGVQGKLTDGAMTPPLRFFFVYVFDDCAAAHVLKNHAVAETVGAETERCASMDHSTAVPVGAPAEFAECFLQFFHPPDRLTEYGKASGFRSAR